MLPDDFFDLGFGLRFGRLLDVAAIVEAALHEDRQRRCADDPVAIGRNTVQPSPVAAAGGQQRHVAELGLVVPEPLHHGEEQLGVGPSEREAAGLFFINVASQQAAHLWRGILPMDASQEDREVPHVHCIFLLKVNLVLVPGDRASTEVRPCPVMFAIHDTEQPFTKLLGREWFHRCTVAKRSARIAPPFRGACRWIRSRFKNRTTS